MGPLISAEKRSCGERHEVRHWETPSYPGRAVFTQRESGDVIDLALTSVSSSNTHLGASSPARSCTLRAQRTFAPEAGLQRWPKIPNLLPADIAPLWLPACLPTQHQEQAPCNQQLLVCHPDSRNAKAAILGNYSPVSHAAHIPAAVMQRIRAKQGIPKTGIRMLSPALPQRHLRAGTCHSILEGFHHDAIRQGGGQQSHLFPHSAKELLGFWGLELHFLEGMGICGARKRMGLTACLCKLPQVPREGKSTHV